MGKISVGALAILVAALIVSTEAHRRWCYCDLRYSNTRLVSGDKIDSLPILYNTPDPTYHHWLSVGCKRVNWHCPYDCLAEAHKLMGTKATPSSYFTSVSGKKACIHVGRNAPPSNKIYVYASYEPSNCAGRSWQLVTALCCWEVPVAGFGTDFFLNERCRERVSPLCKK